MDDEMGARIDDRAPGEPLRAWLERLKASTALSLKTAGDEEMLYTLGMLDRLAVGEYGEELVPEISNQLAVIWSGWQTDAHTLGWRRLQVVGSLAPEEAEIVEELRAMIQAELLERFERRGCHQT